MRRLGWWRWWVGLFVLSACGARSGILLSGLTEENASSAGGSGTVGTQTSTGSQGGQVYAGMTAGGGLESAAGMVTRDPITGAAGAIAGPIAGPKVATMVSAGADMSCAAMTDGSVWCWGGNGHGQLGDGTNTDSRVPVRVKAISSAVAVSAGGTWNSGGKGAALSAFACAVLKSGAVVCWGDHFGAADVDPSRPHTIAGVEGAIAVACGNAHACALTRGGSVLCWGANSVGQLGRGDNAPCPGALCAASEPVVGISGASVVAGQGSNFSCAVLADGSVWCWGEFYGPTESDGLPGATLPVAVAGVSASATGLGVGRSGACAVARDGSKLQCWGGSSSDSVPMTVQGLRSTPVAVSVGMDTSCALLGDGTVQCWGEGRRGQLGDDSYVTRQVPVDVYGLSDAVSVSLGYLHACALRKSGHVSCWGANDGGLGSGASGDRDSAVPVPVTGL